MLCLVLTLEFPTCDLAINPALVPLLPKHLAGRLPELRQSTQTVELRDKNAESESGAWWINFPELSGSQTHNSAQGCTPERGVAHTFNPSTWGVETDWSDHWKSEGSLVCVRKIQGTRTTQQRYSVHGCGCGCGGRNGTRSKTSLIFFFPPPLPSPFPPSTFPSPLLPLPSSLPPPSFLFKDKHKEKKLYHLSWKSWIRSFSC